MINQSNIQLKLNYPTLAGIMMMVIHLGAIADVQASSDADYSFLIDSDWHNCQQINTDYQEVYAFETSSFYINICQKDNAYFYSGEAKQSNTSSMFIPATPLKHRHGFQAKNGNVAYVVILPFPEEKNLKSTALAPEEAILTIKRNDELVAVESSVHKYCRQSKAIANFPQAFEQIKLNHQAFNQLAMIPHPEDFGGRFFSSPPANILEIFHTNSRFDFYRLDGELHRLHTCS